MYNNFFNPMQRNNNGRNQQSGYNQNQVNFNQDNRNRNNYYQEKSNFNPQRTSDEKVENSNNSFQSGPDLMNNQKLSGIDPVKLKIIMEIREKSKNKSVEELLPEIMKINQELNRRNMNFSKNETEMLMEVIEESLSPADRQRFNMIKGFLN